MRQTIIIIKRSVLGNDEYCIIIIVVVNMTN